MSSGNKKLTGSFSVAGAATCDQGSLMAALNDFARASAQIYPGDTGGVADVPMSAIASLFGAAQQRSLTQTGSSFSGSISGDGGSLKFSGFEVGPSMSLSVGAVSPMFHAIHATGSLQRLDASIYAAADVPMEDIVSSDAVSRITQVLERVVEYWIKTTYPKLADKAKVAVSQIHDANTSALKILRKILDNSDGSEIDGLGELSKTVGTVNRAVNNYIASSLTAPSGNGGYLGNLLSLAQTFGMLYAPTIGASGENGSLVNVRNALDAPEDLDVDSITMTGTVRLPEIPYTHVVVPYAPTASVHHAFVDKSETMVGGQIVRGAVKYPSGAVTGNPYVAPPPPFLTGAFTNANEGMSYGRKLSQGKAHNAVETLDRLMTAQADAVRKYMTGYARDIFARVHMEHAQAGCTIPFNSKAEVGKAFKVSCNGELFTGILASVTHSVSSAEFGPAAYSQLQFSHVRWKGYSPKL